MQLLNAKKMQTMDKGGNGASARKKMRKQLVPRKERSTVGEFRVANPRMSCRNVDVYYNHGDKKAINNIVVYFL